MGVLEAIAEGGGLVVMAVSQFETGSSLLWGCQLQLVRGALWLGGLGGQHCCEVLLVDWQIEQAV